jgi:hypothetical protein
VATGAKPRGRMGGHLLERWSWSGVIGVGPHGSMGAHLSVRQSQGGHVAARDPSSLEGEAKEVTMGAGPCGSIGFHISKRWVLKLMCKCFTWSSCGSYLHTQGTWCPGYRHPLLVRYFKYCTECQEIIWDDKTTFSEHMLRKLNFKF